MSKTTANESDVGNLHSALTRVFTGVLKKYEKQLEIANNIDISEDIEGDMIQALIETSEPSPAMLGAVAKFLKDNDIMYDRDEVEELSAHQRRLNALKEARRGKVVNMADIPLVDHG